MARARGIPGYVLGFFLPRLRFINHTPKLGETLADFSLLVNISVSRSHLGQHLWERTELRAKDFHSLKGRLGADLQRGSVEMF